MAFFKGEKRKLSILSMVATIFVFIFNSIAIASFSIGDEIKVGKEFYEKLEKNNALVKDAAINKYINDIGQLILSKSNKAPFDFNFYVIKSSAINAFATPGGYVYINRGLITLTENESQLASVLAHEIAHVNSRHIADIISKSQIVNIGALAAMLAGAFLGGGGEITAAVMGFSLATATHLNLKYSREHEEEADRLGVSYMSSAGYDISSTLEFLRLMRRYEFYSNSVPSYFLTHPETDFRIRYLDSLIQTQYKDQGKTNIFNQFKKVKVFMMVNSGNIDSALNHYQTETVQSPNDSDAFYGLGMAQFKLGYFSDAEKSFQRALSLAPTDVYVLRGLGVCYIKNGKASQALPHLTKAYEIDPNDYDTIIDLGKAYESIGNYTEALNMYKKAENQDGKNDKILYDLAMTYGKTNNAGESHYYFGMYFKNYNKQQSALFHFREALKFFTKDPQKSHKIQEEIKSLTDQRIK